MSKLEKFIECWILNDIEGMVKNIPKELMDVVEE